MAHNIRIIPRLDIKSSNLIKGIHLEGLRVLGKPEDFARYYYENGADELLYIDIVASLYGRNSLLHIIEKTASEIFIPLTVGGGLRSIGDIRTVLRSGADKVALNSAAIARPEFIREASQEFGSSAIVVSIEAIKKSNGTYECYTENGRVRTGVNALDWAKQAIELGAGEILVTSIDREGTGKGFDLELTRSIAEAVPIPVIACGGAGKLSHVYEVITQAKADAVSLASLLHYRFIKDRKYMLELFNEGNTDFLCSSREYSKVETVTLDELKVYLEGRGIECRRVNYINQ